VFKAGFFGREIAMSLIIPKNERCGPPQCPKCGVYEYNHKCPFDIETSKLSDANVKKIRDLIKRMSGKRILSKLKINFKQEYGGEC
jgi:hypothetical protein